MPGGFVRPPHISKRDWAAMSWHGKDKLTRAHRPPREVIPEHQSVQGRPRGTKGTKETCLVCGKKIVYMAKHLMNKHPDFTMGE